jgi:hypothetical protein
VRRMVLMWKFSKLCEKKKLYNVSLLYNKLHTVISSFVFLINCLNCSKTLWTPCILITKYDCVGADVTSTNTPWHLSYYNGISKHWAPRSPSVYKPLQLPQPYTHTAHSWLNGSGFFFLSNVSAAKLRKTQYSNRASSARAKFRYSRFPCKNTKLVSSCTERCRPRWTSG